MLFLVFDCTFFQMKQEGIAYYYKDIKIKVVEMIEFLSEYERKRSMKLETLLLRDFFKKRTF
jgi:hypothetical protein